jgi:CheY-like chemotaxis protein
MGKQLNVLIVEDSKDDALLLADNLRRGGNDPVCQRVDTADDMSRALDEKAWDLVIADYSMPHFDGLSALDLVKGKGDELPFIILYDAIDSVYVDPKRM